MAARTKSTKEVASGPTPRDPDLSRQRNPAEIEYRKELAALEKSDRGERPVGWKLSPHAVRDFISGRAQGIETETGTISISGKAGDYTGQCEARSADEPAKF